VLVTLSLSKGEMTVRAAVAADLAALQALGVAIIDAARQDAILAQSVAAGGCLVATHGAGYAGFATWDRGFFNRPFVRLLAVAPAFRRRGVARALLRAVEAAARPAGELFVSTEQINVPMQNLLSSLGYEPSGSIDHLNAPGNLELVFYKRLGPASE
jgi:GNAT superfamily N-acetyltransferase